MSQKLSAAEKIVLSVLQKNAKGSMNANRLWSRLPADCGLKKDDTYNALLRLTQKKLVAQVSKGNFMYLHPPKEMLGYIQFSKSGDAYVVVGDKNSDEPDIFVPSEFVSNALPGDLVAVETMNGKRKSVARVSRVVERSTTPIVGVLEVFEKRAFLNPDKKTFPFDIRITSVVNAELNGFKASVRITDFLEKASNPEGVVLEILGKSGSNDAEMHSIVAEFGFRVAFGDEVENETLKFPENLNPNQIWKDRKDFRKTLTLTIDPADAKDFDDAISYRKLDNGNHEVGVHIADVSHYVTKGSAIDTEAIMRGTSVYLADRTIPMLPEKLSNNLCSLKPNEDRLAFSVVMELDSNSQVIARWFGKTVIHSQRRFSYEEAQERLTSKVGDLSDELNILNTLAKNLSKQRFSAGAMSFESDEIRFEMDAKGKPLKVLLKKRFDAHKLIEEFMLLANKEVAEFVYTKQKPILPYIYRSHDSPSNEKLMDLLKFCQLFGYKIDISNEARFRKTLNEMLLAVKDKPEEDVIVQTAIRSMAKAVYTGQRTDHFGLAFQYYTHFTSPIRRYPDLMAHRMLNNYLLNEKSGYTEDEIEALAKQSSNAEQKAAEAERASTKYKMAEYLSDHIGMVFEAVISGVTEWGIFAEIIENHCEGMIRISDMKGDRYVFNERERKVRGMRTGRSMGLGDVISVRVKNANPQLRMIDFTIAD